MFWLFIIGSVLGVLIEGVWCLFIYKRWETHVVSMWGPFCIIYGIGAVGFYIGSAALKSSPTIVKFLVFATIGTLVEFSAGLILEYGLGVKAWDYSHQRFNVMGYVSPQMSAAWGALGLIFSRFIMPLADKLFSLMNDSRWNLICVVFSVFMAVNLAFTAICLIRWSKRHYGVPPSNAVDILIDKRYNDSFMADRFCEWRFIENAPGAQGEAGI